MNRARLLRSQHKDVSPFPFQELLRRICRSSKDQATFRDRRKIHTALVSAGVCCTTRVQNTDGACPEAPVVKKVPHGQRNIVTLLTAAEVANRFAVYETFRRCAREYQIIVLQGRVVAALRRLKDPFAGDAEPGGPYRAQNREASFEEVIHAQFRLVCQKIATLCAAGTPLFSINLTTDDISQPGEYCIYSIKCDITDLTFMCDRNLEKLVDAVFAWVRTNRAPNMHLFSTKPHPTKPKTKPETKPETKPAIENVPATRSTGGRHPQRPKTTAQQHSQEPKRHPVPIDSVFSTKDDAQHYQPRQARSSTRRDVATTLLSRKRPLLSVESEGAKQLLTCSIPHYVPANVRLSCRKDRFHELMAGSRHANSATSLADCRQGDLVYIKRADASCGKDIHLTMNCAKDLPRIKAKMSKDAVVVTERAFQDPMLYRDRKVDLRVYVMTRWVNGALEARMYDDALVRVAQMPYDAKSLDTRVHLTNTSIGGGDSMSLRAHFPETSGLILGGCLEVAQDVFEHLVSANVLVTSAESEREEPVDFWIWGLDVFVPSDLAKPLKIIELNLRPMTFVSEEKLGFKNAQFKRAMHEDCRKLLLNTSEDRMWRALSLESPPPSTPTTAARPTTPQTIAAAAAAAVTTAPAEPTTPSPPSFTPTANGQSHQPQQTKPRSSITEAAERKAILGSVDAKVSCRPFTQVFRTLCKMTRRNHNEDTVNKRLCNQLLLNAGVQCSRMLPADTPIVPASRTRPFVMKPIDGMRGKDISFLTSREPCRPGFVYEAFEQYASDYRIVIIDGLAVATIRRWNERVPGNGVATLSELLRKGENGKCDAEQQLRFAEFDTGLRRDEVVPAGTSVRKWFVTNGAYRVNDRASAEQAAIHPQFQKVCADVAACFPKAHVLGLDLTTDDLSQPGLYCVHEVNSLITDLTFHGNSNLRKIARATFDCANKLPKGQLEKMMMRLSTT